MSILVVLDGQYCPPAEPTVSVFDRGFLYGDSVFETLRTYGGKPFELEEHLRRLERSAELVFIPLPLSRSELQREVLAAIAAAGNAESYVRLMVTLEVTCPLAIDGMLRSDAAIGWTVGPWSKPWPSKKLSHSASPEVTTRPGSKNFLGST